MKIKEKHYVSIPSEPFTPFGLSSFLFDAGKKYNYLNNISMWVEADYDQRVDLVISGWREETENERLCREEIEAIEVEQLEFCLSEDWRHHQARYDLGIKEFNRRKREVKKKYDNK